MRPAADAVMMIRPDRCFAHVRQHRLRQLHDAEHVHIVKLPDLLHAEVFQKSAQPHAGEMHHGVDAPHLPDNGAHRPVDVRALGHVHAQRRHFYFPFLALLPQLLLFAIRQRCAVDTKVVGGQMQGGSQPQAGSCAGDQYNGSIVSHSVPTAARRQLQLNIVDGAPV